MGKAKIPIEKQYYSVYIVFDSGFVFDFDHIRDEIRYCMSILEELRKIDPRHRWRGNEKITQRVSEFQLYAPPSGRYLFNVELNDDFKDFSLTIPWQDSSIDCHIYRADAFLFLFNTGVLHFEFTIDEKYWQDIPAITQIMDFFNNTGLSLIDSAKQLQDLFQPILHRVRSTFAEAVRATDPPLLEVPFVNLKKLIGDADKVRWSHIAMIGIMDKDFDPETEHYQACMSYYVKRGVTNYAIIPGNFAFTGEGRSLFCVPNKLIRGMSPEKFVINEWLQWLRANEETWKMVWELDHALAAVINTTTNNLKYMRDVVSSSDISHLNAFINYIWLVLDTHKARNITGYTKSVIHYLNSVDKHWETHVIEDEIIVKMEALQQVVHQINEYGDAGRKRSMSRFLALLGVFGLGTFLMAYHGQMDFMQGVGDLTTSAIVFAILAIFSFIAYYIIR